LFLIISELFDIYLPDSGRRLAANGFEK